MGSRTYYCNEHEFVLTVISGELNDEILMEHVLSLNKATEGIQNLRELGDCRRMSDLDGLTVRGTSRCADMEDNRPFSLLAIVVDDQPLHYGLARAYQAFSESRRKEVRIFADMDEALAWLAPDDREFESLSQFIIESQADA